ncbi:xylose isomerase [Clostridia bacterium]|nr:xylose isomerase [Clostridia bacterium]
MKPTIHAGIASVTLRQYAYRNFIKNTKLTSLEYIEWGSDIHVPRDNLNKAVKVEDEMTANSLFTSSYGSYYRLGSQMLESGDKTKVRCDVIATAKALHASTIRIWGGDVGSSRITPEMRETMVADAIEFAAIAGKNGLSISLEYHLNTITDTPDSAVDFIKEVRSRGADNIFLYWQINPYIDHRENLTALTKVMPYLTNIHVFAWEKDTRLPLEAHKSRWLDYVNLVKNISTMEKHCFLMEFVKNDSVEQLIEDAAVLCEIIKEVTR